ncbi:alanine racemase [Sandarakinorhabdus sp. AAP62]|uniref:alanine racemase n=1 Tax=Sandarakinorhabdus sp. AAP62 TaxID=1248916 RepID=UPI0002DE3035|nr:alanine racemase [Sandarakinorhabdus sp. AAP62]
MHTLSTLPTPALLLDRGIAARNMARMQGHLAGVASGVLFRPHLKTAKSIAVADMLFGGGRHPITVSTLKEAELFGAAGFADILYAVGLSPQKIASVQALREKGINLTVVTDNIAMAAAICAAAPGGELPTLIELDVDGHRAGVAFDDGTALIAIAAALGPNFAGVMTHAGGSYALSDPDALAQAADLEAARAAAARHLLEQAGHACRIVSIGSTPTGNAVRNLDGVTEFRAGVFMFGDLVMHGVGVCPLEDIALSVLATVIGTYPDRGLVIVDAGWMALSRDRGTSGQAVDQGYGLVCAADGTVLDDVIVVQANQEHGVIGVRPGAAARLPDLQVGDRLRILPNHACATAAQHGWYNVVDSGSDRIAARWERFNGW